MLKIVILFTLLLAGCGTNPPVVQTIVKVISPDDSLLLDCVIPSPPPKNDYIKATMSEREKMLMSYTGNLLKDSFICNSRFSALREWKVMAITSVTDSNK